MRTIVPLPLLSFFLSVGLGSAQTPTHVFNDKEYLKAGYLVKYFSARDCKGPGLLAVKLLNPDVYDEPKQGCITTTKTPDGTYESDGLKPLTTHVLYEKDGLPPSEAGYMYMQYDEDDSDACGVITTIKWQQYWYLGMCAVTKNLDNYFTLHNIDYNATSFDVTYTEYNIENIDCNSEGSKELDRISYDLNCDGSTKDYWVQLYNMQDDQTMNIDYAGILRSYNAEEGGCDGYSKKKEIFNVDHAEDILHEYDIDEIVYDSCRKAQSENSSDYYEAQCEDNLNKGFMEVNLDTLESFACAGSTPVVGTYYEDNSCQSTMSNELPYNSISYANMVFYNNNVSYTVLYYEDDQCKNFTNGYAPTVEYIDLSIQCGKNVFYVAYPLGYHVDCTKGAGEDDDYYFVDDDDIKRLDNFEMWVIFISCGVFALLVTIPTVIWCWKRKRSNNSENDLLNQALLGSHQDVK